MKNNTIKAGTIIGLSSILICLDSLLKINLGSFHLQLGVAIILLASPLIFLSLKSEPTTLDATYFVLLIYIFLNFPFAINKDVFLTGLSYVLIFTILYKTIGRVSRFINWERVSTFALLTLIITGFFQYSLINIFDHQLELRGIDASYYQHKGNLGYRMRGFFLEPNWFGLTLFSWSFLFIYKKASFSTIDFLILLLTAVCIYLSENRLIYILYLYIITMFFFSKRAESLSKLVPVLSVSVAIFIYILLSISGLDLTDRSAAARTYTMAQTWNVWIESSLIEKIFGYGFSNWGYYSNLWELSWSNYRFDQALTRRDNAEIYVFLFEMGLASIILFMVDLFFIGKKSKKPILPIFISSIYISSFFYPIFNFLFYLIPMMVVRHEILKKNQ
ncbi:hypothetical protein [Pseudomonas abyssi]|uniref:hypothetical protein n=1 Tax=Pseudomonas abyssi TaxID=170540 RepID=UPI003C7D093B